MAFDLFSHPVVMLRPRIVRPYAWVGHIPFAYLLVDLVKPRVFVELGTDSGNSYLAFCQAVKHLDLPTQCTAVDSWTGDEHARFYGEQIYANLRGFHDPRYAAFSRLLRMSFNDAVDQFEDGSIDLLHIDGLHTYEAVKHDFETWRGKLSDRAVVVFHDSQVRADDFGVYRFTDEIAARYRTFEFTHSNGLVVAEVGRHVPGGLSSFMTQAIENPEATRAFFESIAATLLDDKRDALPVGQSEPTFECRLYYRGEHEPFAEERSLTLGGPVLEGVMNHRFALPAGADVFAIRIDPADLPCQFGLTHIGLESRDGGVHDRLDDPSARMRASSCEPLPAVGAEFVRMLSFHSDPYVEFVLEGAWKHPSRELGLIEVGVVYEALASDAYSQRVARGFDDGLQQLGARDSRWGFSSLARLFDEQVERLAKVEASLRDERAHRAAIDSRMALQASAGERLAHEVSGLKQLMEQEGGLVRESIARTESAFGASSVALSAALGKQTKALDKVAATQRRSRMRLQKMRHELDARLGQMYHQQTNMLRALEDFGKSRWTLRGALQRFWYAAKGAAGPMVAMQMDRSGDVLLGASAEGESHWIPQTRDPRFHLAPDGGYPLAAGWYLVECDLRATADRHLILPGLYPDYGDGLSEARFVRLQLSDGAGDGGNRRAIVMFERPVYDLRFDPTQDKTAFSFSWMNLRQLPKWRAAWLMLSAVVGRHRRGGEQARVFKRFSSLLLSRGARRFADTLYSAYTRASAGAGSDEQYAAWLAAYDGADPSGSTTVVEALAHKPLISIVMPVYNTPDKWLRRCIESVRAQSYPHWQLCIADDASPDPSVRRTLEELSRSDDRINVVFREENGHISRTSNSALELARGEFTALLDHDDELHPDALLEVAKAVNGHPEWEVIYSDEDKIDEAGRRFDPYFKSDWNYDLFLSHNCISHLGVYRTSLMRDVGGFRCGFEGSQDWDLALRCIEKLDPARIGHIPRVLYHWRAIPGSTALAPGEKNYAHLAAVKSIQAHLDRIGRHARVEPLAEFPGNYRVVNVLEREPLVSLVIPTRDQVGLLRQCVDSILRETAYRNYEIIIIDNQSSEAATLAYLKKVVADERVRVIAYDAPFNYSAINNLAAENATGEILALVNNDIEVISSGWLTEMVSQAMRPDIGAVGAMLYFPDDTIQHAGVLLGFNGIAVNMYGSKPRGWLGQLLRAQLIQNYSAVTAACLVVRKDVFEEVDGFDERLGVAYNDVDFCLRLREKGYRNLWTPYAELYHHESASRGAEDTPEKRARFEAEVEYMYERWGDLIGDDPAYNPNLATYGDFNDFAFPPRGRAD